MAISLSLSSGVGNNLLERGLSQLRKPEGHLLRRPWMVRRDNRAAISKGCYPDQLTVFPCAETGGGECHQADPKQLITLQRSSL